MDISFPQPVPMTNAETSDSFPSPSGRMYVDQDIEQDNAYDTFFIPYSNITKIHYSNYSKSLTTFIFDLTTPPTFGGVIPKKPQSVTLAIDIPRGDREQFLASLKDRGLAHRLDQGERKLSKANNDLALGHPPSQSHSQTFPEKTSRGDLGLPSKKLFQFATSILLQT
ncbi:hypothetical protein BT96DRAFT_74051 [Gymnopus androsaceus JB14]|uniref:Uncharacterized protein n=1 Tax=Gymnopus androsaceus JB14 TaxID=1447944 RepID=A0A6A4GD45_9AGAR|nr:hypothetical protein BT96DRAFT_74051 [Gymnopus androsaceus JB14]